MKKITDFLEQYVEWVALAVGALFLLFMVFQYVLSEPVSVDLSGKSFSPGDVDREIREQAARLEDRINPRSEPPVRIEVAQAVGEFDARLAMVNVEQKPTLQVFASEPLKLPTTSGGGVVQQPADGPIELQGAVATLASVPAAVLTESFAGRAYVNIPPAGVRPVIGAPPPAAGAALEGVQEDRQWVRVNYRIPISQLNIAFRQAKLPLSAVTLVHQVQLVRQELQPDNTWSEEVVVKGIGTVMLQKPPSGENPQEAGAFLQWAQANQQDILRPTFYQVLIGNDPIFGPPGDNAPPVGMTSGGTPGAPQPAGFDAAAWLDTPPAQRVPPVGQLTEEQRRAIQAEQARRNQEKRSQPQPGRDRPPGGGRRGGGGPGGGGFGESFGKPDPERPPFLQVRRPPPGVPPEYLEDPTLMGEPGSMPGQPTVPNAVLYDPLPQPPYNPAEVPTDLVGWAYDESPTPGRTYRYAIRYSIKNPLYGTFNMAADPAHARVLNLHSATSEWSQPVSIEPLLHFFIAQRFAPSAANVKVKVFRWSQGAWRAGTFTAGCGDTIGGVENQVDYSTGCTLVDLRTEPGEGNRSYALFIDERGAMIRRDTDVDLNDPLRMKLEAEAAAAPVPGVSGEPSALVR